jgi:hypothetical protein
LRALGERIFLHVLSIYRALEILPLINLMWNLKLRSQSKYTPRYLIAGVEDDEVTL